MDETTQAASLIKKLPPSWQDTIILQSTEYRDMSFADLIVHIGIREQNRQRKKEIIINWIL